MSAFMNNPWIVAIGSGVIILLLPGIWSAVARIEFGQAYSSVAGWIWSNLLGPRLPVWVFLAAIVSVLIIARIISRALARKTNGISLPTVVPTAKPDYFAYTRDAIRYWTFRWTYFPEERGMPPTIVNLHAVCPKCDAPLLKDKPHYITREINGMYCAICRATFPLFEDAADSAEIGTIVRHRIQTGGYRASADSGGPHSERIST
jgi:hypothetical protein